MATEVMTDPAATATEAPVVTDPSSDDGAAVGVAPSEELVEDELLVEEVSIDGMCGVY